MSGTAADKFDQWVVNALGKEAENIIARGSTGGATGPGTVFVNTADIEAMVGNNSSWSSTSSDTSSSSSGSTGFAEVARADQAAALPISPKPQWAAGIDLSQAKMGKAIKSGSFGSVSWLDGAGPTPLVMKVPKTDATRAELAHEAEFYGKIGEHPNIAKCMGIQEVNGQRGLVMEGIKGKDMHGAMDRLEALRKGDKGAMKAVGADRALSQEKYVGTLQYMLTQTLQGLSKLEEQGVVHADIRPDNIMCDATTGDVKLVDLGLAFDAGSRPKVAPVGHGSVAPELSDVSAGMTSKYDVFSAGEIAHKGMERDQFRYGKAPGVGMPGNADVRNFAAPDGAGKAKSALNPMTPPPPGAPAGGLPFERMSKLEARIRKLMNDPFVKGTPPAQELDKTLDKHQDAYYAATDEDSQNKALEAFEKAISAAEGRFKTVGKFGADTAYTKFVNWAMNPDPTQRPTAKEALEHPFLADRLLDDESAKAVLKSVLAEPPAGQASGGSGSDTLPSADLTGSTSSSGSGFSGLMPGTVHGTGMSRSGSEPGLVPETPGTDAGSRPGTVFDDPGDLRGSDTSGSSTGSSDGADFNLVPQRADSGSIRGEQEPEQDDPLRSPPENAYNFDLNLRPEAGTEEQDKLYDAPDNAPAPVAPPSGRGRRGAQIGAHRAASPPLATEPDEAYDPPEDAPAPVAPPSGRGRRGAQIGAHRAASPPLATEPDEAYDAPEDAPAPVAPPSGRGRRGAQIGAYRAAPPPATGTDGAYDAPEDVTPSTASPATGRGGPQIGTHRGTSASEADNPPAPPPRGRPRMGGHRGGGT